MITVLVDGDDKWYFLDGDGDDDDDDDDDN
jgi:hypothetical protein